MGYGLLVTLVIRRKIRKADVVQEIVQAVINGAGDPPMINVASSLSTSPGNIFTSRDNVVDNSCQ